MKTFEETASLCALNRIFGFEPKIGIALLQHFGNATEIMRLTPKDQELILGPHSKYSGKFNIQTVEKTAEELIRLKEQHIRFIGLTHENYPALLKECEDSPIGLYVRSTSPFERIFSNRPCISIVGTRDLSLYGKEWCEKTVQSLSQTADIPVIISGLALGTDICAHKTAVECGIPTIGVMATGPEKIYPWRHTDFAERLIHTPGCALISDYPPETAPLAIHFLRRNRIIAGLSKATILIESKIRGGGMMTCRLAFSYGRDVYALPGRVDDTRSQGCNLLIKEKIAEPLISTQELTQSLDLLPLSSSSRNASEQHIITRTYGSRLSQDKVSQMAEIIIIIRKHRGITIEEISDVTQIEYSRIAELTRLLETDGMITIDLLQRCTINIRK
jgi:DNA processing protein